MAPLTTFILLLLQTPLLAFSTLHRPNHRQRSLDFDALTTTQQQQQKQGAPITRYFEVTKPINLPNTKPCSTLLLQHDFAFTYGKPPVTADYSPPTHCSSASFSKVVLEWTATSAGRQFDRIFGVWIGGVELLRSCTAEPMKNGTIWTVEKDVTRYSSLFKSPQTLAVYLANIVDNTYTGVYHVNVTLHFYPGPVSGDAADLIVPISRELNNVSGDALWFSVQNSSDYSQVKEFSVPRNTYRAMLEVFVSFHQNDEFWYGNPPNDYISANNLSNPGNGPFREVVVSLDGAAVGAVWPFTVIYTGGVNPLLWRPITGIGSFDLPSYEIEITPFVGKILDGKMHRFGFTVTNGLNVWFIDANLHLWLDHKSLRTAGKLIEYMARPARQWSNSKFKGLEGTFVTSASRFITSTGWVKSSKGIVTTHAYQSFAYRNKMEFKKGGNLQIVKQTIDANHGVYVKIPFMIMQSNQLHQNFQLDFFTDFEELTHDIFLENDNVSLSFNEEKFAGGHFGLSYSSLSNLEHGQGFMNVTQNKVTSGIGSTHQIYMYNSKDNCYYRDVSARNFTVLHDDSGKNCSKGWSYGRGLPFTPRLVSLASDFQVPNRMN